MKYLIAILCLVLARCASAPPDKTVVSSMEDEDFLARFVHENCGYEWQDRAKQSGKVRRDCVHKWSLVLSSKLHQKYPQADLKVISDRCDDLGERCGLNDMERIAQELQDAANKKK